MNYDIISNQSGLYQHLEKTVLKHLNTPFLKPVAHSSQLAFENLNQIIAKQSINQPIILDSCCGTGMSTVNLAQLYPESFIIGIDKSIHRLNKADKSLPNNMILIRADMIDLWRLIKTAKWAERIKKHFIFYPNPYPKSQHFQRRLHGHAVFPVLLSLSPYLEIRSNWKIYIEEFQVACKLAGYHGQLNLIKPDKPMTLFERKYLEAGQGLYQFVGFYK